MSDWLTRSEAAELLAQHAAARAQDDYAAELEAERAELDAEAYEREEDEAAATWEDEFGEQAERLERDLGRPLTQRELRGLYEESERWRGPTR